MAKLNKVVGTLAAAAVLATLAPIGASAATVDTKAVKATEEGTFATDRILVKVKAGKEVNEVAAKHSAKVERALANGKSEWKLVKVKDAKEAKAKFEADADVEAVSYDYIRTANVTTPNDPSYSSQWHLPKVQANYAWDITKGTTSRTIAIIDTGIDIQHTDLASKIVAGYDFVNYDSNADDDQGHGTHCAGIAAALSNNSNSVAGVDWNARLMPVKVLDAAGSGYDSDIIDGIYWAVDHGAHVLSMSLGGGGYSQASQDAVNYAWNSGRIVVAAAGNENTSAYSYPAAYANVISVASTTSTDARSSFSNYGSWVDVAAPGSSILSTRNGGGTTTMSGTSMATPLVAGLASLTWSKNTAYSNTSVRDRIFSTADKISGTGTYWVNGRVNAYKAVNGF